MKLKEKNNNEIDRLKKKSSVGWHVKRAVELPGVCVILSIFIKYANRDFFFQFKKMFKVWTVVMSLCDSYVRELGTANKFRMKVSFR